MPFLLLSYVKALRVKYFFINDFDGEEEEKEEDEYVDLDSALIENL